jgi:glycosyltransferase involved in cell wall biosynthesis
MHTGLAALYKSTPFLAEVATPDVESTASHAESTFNDKDIADKLLDAISNPAKLKEMDRLANSKLEDLSWERTASEFGEILKACK